MVRTAFRLMAALACLSASLARGSEVWTGGSRAWGDLTTPGNEGKWTFVRANVDGLYANNFSMRPNESTVPTREERLTGMYRLLANKRVLYETDRVHSTDDFDRDSLAAFDRVGFAYAGATINYGTDDGRTALITRDGKAPLYYMFGPWNADGDIAKPKNDKLRAEILKYDGAAVDDPVTMWRGPAGRKGTRPAVYSTVKWCHAHGKKLLFLLAPNESGDTFLPEAQQLVRDLEDHDATPDLFGVEFYGPQSFRDKLPVLPESTPDGKPARTFAGVPYWLIHHLRDPKGWARLSLPGGESDGVMVNVTNSSPWLHLTPVVRLRPLSGGSAGVRATLDGTDVTSELLGDGVVFNRDRRLEPGTTRQLVLHVDKASTNTWRLDLLPHPSELGRVNQSVIVRTR